MCAIAGILDLHAAQAVIDCQLRTMTRRGPDASAYFQEGACALLHARLAVIDPTGGAQPMQLTFAGETYTIIYNGELYNTPQLRRELEKLGHHFIGHSDTEVLLHGYAQWGSHVVEKCNGIFAFAVWEHGAKRLFLARDRMGVKPLFYKLHQGGLLFASEIKTILAYPTVRSELDEQGAAEILLLGPGRMPGCGVFRGIQEIEPGWCGYYAQGKLELKRYWYLQDREHRENFEETAEMVRALVTDAILGQTVSDVPIGTFLSGGLDSSLITAVCAGEMAKKGQWLTTFSVDYVDNDKYFVPNKFQPNSDGHYIRLMQSAFHTDHHWCILSPQDLVDALEDATIARDLPGMADVDFSLLAFCRKIKDHVTVALSGECADEIFGGYPWYRDPEIRDRDGFPWAQNTAQRCRLLSPALTQKLDGEDYVQQRYLDTCRQSDILPGTSSRERRMKEMVNLNQRWFMQTLLDRKDRMSMYSGLEVRVPFCDHRIAEYLYGVPWEFKDYRGKEKGLLRHAMAAYLPEEVLWRKKSPYPKTFDPKYLELVSLRLRKLLDKKDAPLFALISKTEAESILTQDAPWPWYGQLMRRPQTIAYLLQINFWLEHYHVELVF
ncbi:MAG: asparagine synthase (glutamine-hydrolyzing) [Oscillospiraceae bacterium]|nr:asparagine synthase (glutamine-hydrolyzing) [Oscillospiraceae bacterium]